jgi:chemotaxis protein histidine kinase CheA
MTEQECRDLQQAGVDVAGSLERFCGNEALLTRFWKEFLRDPSFADLQRAAAEGNVEDAFRAAHSLKGAAANLGLVPIVQAASPCVEALRAGDAGALAPESLQPLLAEYARICAALRAALHF